MFKIKKVAIINCLFLSSFFLNPFWASNFDLMGTSAFAQTEVFGVASDSYGNRCSSCRGFFSEGYCQRICCDSCQSSRAAAGGDASSCISSICSESYAPNQSDLNFLKRCTDSGYNGPGCDGMETFVSQEQLVEHNHQMRKRSDSCEEAAEYTKKLCNVNLLDKPGVVEIFNIAKQINSSAGACEENYGSPPRSSMYGVQSYCNDSFNECKTFCFDQNEVRSNVNGATLVYDNENNQSIFENSCKPIFSKFDTELKRRDSIISSAADKLEECNDGREANDTLVDNPSRPTSPPNNPNSPVNNPEVALNRLNQLTSLVQPFVTPQTTSNYNPGLYSNGEVANNGLYSNGQGSTLSYEEKYGPQYQGYDSGGSNDYDYIENTGFDKPDSLKTPSSAQPQNQNRAGQQGGGNFGGMVGGAGGSFGNGSSSNPPSKAAGKSRKIPKDKSMFGKISGPSGASSLGETLAKKNGKRNYGSSNLKNGSNKPQFNASKYHAQIMASYNRGQDSRAQVVALRRAAGLKVETFDEKRKKGYTNWHAEHKIHPENISLFMQARICYHTKFRSDFAESCEFK